MLSEAVRVRLALLCYSQAGADSSLSFCVYSLIPQRSLGYKILHLCVSSWRFIAFFRCDFDDTAVAAMKVVAHLRRNCVYFLSFFRDLSKWTHLKADMPQTPLCSFVRQVGEPVLHVYLTLRLYWTPHLWFTSTNMHLPYGKIVLQFPIGKPWQKQNRALHLHLNHATLLSYQVHTPVTSDLLFCFKPKYFYGLQFLTHMWTV